MVLCLGFRLKCWPPRHTDRWSARLWGPRLTPSITPTFMMREFVKRLILAILVFLSGTASAQTAHDGVERALGLSNVRDNGVEVRVWVGGVTRVSTVYRIVKTKDGVSAERFAWAEVVHAAKGEYAEVAARRETTGNRRLIQKERCLGKVAENADYIWCKVAIRTDGDWSVLFDDLLPDELRRLPPQGDGSCGSTVVVDGEAVGIDMLEPGRRQSVEYWNPHICCATVACAIADHVRNVVRNIY